METTNVTSESDHQIDKVGESFVIEEPKLDNRIVFRTNSISYLDSLIPMQYRSNLDCESTEPTFKIELADRSYTTYGIKPTPQAIILNVSILEEISRLWWLVIPTLAGAPELIILVNRAPTAMLPTLEQIIRNCGHMKYYSLYDTLYDIDDDDTNSDILDNDPPTVVALKDNNLEPTISMSRILQHLEGEKNGTMEGLWLPQERGETIIRYLDEVIRWTNAPHDPYNGEKFGREEMKQNLLLLGLELKWFRKREMERKMEGRVRNQQQRKRILREKRGLREDNEEKEYGGRRKRIRSEGRSHRRGGRC